jgi:hypothetical protein
MLIPHVQHHMPLLLCAQPYAALSGAKWQAHAAVPHRHISSYNTAPLRSSKRNKNSPAPFSQNNKITGYTSALTIPKL